MPLSILAEAEEHFRADVRKMTVFELEVNVRG